MFRISSKIVLSFCLFSFFLLACNTKEESFKGTIHTIDSQNKKILVISQLRDEDVNIDYRKLLELSNYSEVAWVSGINLSKYKIGDEVEVFYRAKEDSYPSNIEATKIVILK